MLHCVDEKNPTVDKSDKIYKTRPVFNYILERFQKHYVPDQHLSLDEGMIPTKKFSVDKAIHQRQAYMLGFENISVDR